MANIVELKIVRKISNNTSVRLRELVRQVRSAKTISEERAIVERELACIRVSFFNEHSKYKCRNMVKLIYLHMLGYSADFGKIECIKLIGTKDKKFSDIRVGYLGSSLLIDERSDVHLLLTNCFRNHLNDSDMFVVGNALCALGNICSVDMCRGLASPVVKLMSGSTCNFVKKKAALCAYRFVRKAPELSEMFLSSARSLLIEKYNGVLASGIILVCEMCELNPALKTYFDAMIPSLTRSLKNLQVSDFSPRHTGSDIFDPYLQIKILKLLGILGRGDATASEKMNDILSQMTIISCVSSLSAAILFETVLTIIKTKSSINLRNLAVNVIDRFLMDPDKNIRYSSLSLLVKLTGDIDSDVIKRHRNTVLESLRDEDSSIKRLASRICHAPDYRHIFPESEADFLTLPIEISRNKSNIPYLSEEDDKSGIGSLLILDEDSATKTSTVDQTTILPAPCALQNQDILELFRFSAKAIKNNNNGINADHEHVIISKPADAKNKKVDLANLFDINNLNDLVLF